MKKNFSLLYILLIVIFSGCEKVTIEDIKEGAKPDEDGKNVVSSDLSGYEWMTVAEAQVAEIDETICVCGYIVASCTRSINNAVFMPPFEGSTAIILAEAPISDGYFYDDELFPVCLTDNKSIRAALNLEDNPELWERRIAILGTKARYMSRPGMKKVIGFQIVE